MTLLQSGDRRVVSVCKNRDVNTPLEKFANNRKLLQLLLVDLCKVKWINQDASLHNDS